MKLRTDVTEFDSQSFSVEEVDGRPKTKSTTEGPTWLSHDVSNPRESRSELLALVAFLSVAREKNDRLGDTSRSSLRH